MRLRRDVHFGEFLKVLHRQGRPAYLPFYEHVASAGFIAARTGTRFDQMTPDDPGYWPVYVDFWLGMGYDCIPMEIPPALPLASHEHAQGGASHGSEAQAVIRTWEDYERYPWPPEGQAVAYRHFETVARLLPEGVKIVGGVCAGPYEWVSSMMGTIGLSYAMADAPDLVEAVFRRVGAIHLRANQDLAGMDAIGALRQGDDLGFKTSTFLSPRQLREWVFPTYRALAANAHAHGKPFILHSCGNLAEVYDDLIACGIDAKHSFEDVIFPVAEFKRRYGGRITPLGGLDVDTICRAAPADLRRYARTMIERCFEDGWWALGTGNSLTNYMPVENYLAVLDEGLQVAGAAR
ncbi:MAG: methylcobalamin:coenzyme M methyltransferase [Lentisphaerae bacterium ADurb.BinA184]|nr:MAG: methylcobalamin:coenzyme M methyltransferase [Lentisphaerae bacterium ADurb.BinA184]